VEALALEEEATGPEVGVAVAGGGAVTMEAVQVLTVVSGSVSCNCITISKYIQTPLLANDTA